MQSNQERSNERNHSDPIFTIPQEGTEFEDNEAFWKLVRHFYRTGEKPKDAVAYNLMSIFGSISQKLFNFISKCFFGVQCDSSFG